MKSTVFAVSAFCLFVAVCSPAALAENAEPPQKPKAAPLEFYNLFELLNKAEQIVVADIGPTRDGRTTLLVQKTLKAPEADAKKIDAERLKRAQDLLSGQAPDGLAQGPGLTEPRITPAATPAPVSQLLIVADPRIKLPPEGTQAIFFLWEHELAEAGGEKTVYRLGHPQCLYDAELLPQVKAGISRSRAKADKSYLRDSDRIMAERAKQREADLALRDVKGGGVVLGMKVSAIRPMVSIRGNNSFNVTARLENTRSRNQAMYDGPLDGYGVILRPKNEGPESAIVLHHAAKSIAGNVDSSVLGMTDITDFVTIPGNSGMSKELFFDAESIPALKSMHGEYVLNVFCASSQDGKGVDLDEAVWTGTVVSEDVNIRFR